jgi:ADP-heptose:LPS heptosyltransferase
VPALRALADAFPGHDRVLAGPAALAPLARLADPGLEVVDTAPLAPLPPALHGADVAVNLHGRGPQSHAALRAAGPRRVVAFAHPDFPEAGEVAWRAEEHEVARWCRLLCESGIPADGQRLDLEVPPAWAVPAIARGATLVHPGTASGARRWPAERWAAVARAERAAGRRVVLTGGPGERQLATEIAVRAGLGPESVLAGRTDIVGLAATVAAAARVACGDTGVAHLATAFGVPSVVLFGPTPPALWGPPADRPWHVALWAGRRGDPHADEPHEGLLAITPEQVLEALDRLPADRFAA